MARGNVIPNYAPEREPRAKLTSWLARAALTKVTANRRRFPKRNA